MRLGLWLLPLALVLAALVPLLLGRGELSESLRDFSPSLLLAMLGMVALGWWLNSLRLGLLLGRQRPPPLRSLGIVMATEFAICATPGGAGGLLTLMALLARQGIAPARGTAIFAVEQLCDLLFFLCALLGVLCYALTHAVNAQLAGLLGLSAALLLAGLVLLGLLGRFHRQVFRLNGWLMHRLGMPRRRRHRWARRVLGFRNAVLDAFRLPRRTLLGVFGLTVLHWLLRYSVLYLVLRGLDSGLAWAWTFLVQLLALGAGQASLLPGGAGSAELAAAAMLAPLVGASSAAAAILIWRFVTFHFYLIAGAPVFLHLAGRPLLRRLLRARRADERQNERRRGGVNYMNPEKNRSVHMSSGEDKLKGNVNEALGKTKRGFGEATDNERMKSEGERQEVRGEAQQVKGDLKDRAKHGIDKA